MNAAKIIGLVGVILAVVLSVGVEIPFSLELLLIFGLVYGFFTLDENNVRVILSAVTLTIFTEVSHPSALGAIQQIGGYLHTFVANIAIIAEGAALLIIFRNLFKRLMP